MLAFESKTIRNGLLPLEYLTVKSGLSFFTVLEPIKIASTLERNL